MKPARYCFEGPGVLTVDNRPAEHAENLQDEITALRNGLRAAKQECEDLRRQNEELQELVRQRDELIAAFNDSVRA